MTTTATVHDLGPVAAIPVGEGRTFQLAGHSVAVFRTRHNVVHAVQAYCPHRGGELAHGIVGTAKVVCSMHGFAFDLRTGKPCRGTCEGLAVYRVEVDAAGRLRLELPGA